MKKVDDTPVDWKVEFGTIRAGMVPVLKEIRDFAAAEDWPEVMDRARAYDLSFRKMWAVVCFLLFYYNSLFVQ